jgi:hypothetical protein
MNRKAWVENLFRPLAVGGMMGCIALSFVRLIQLFFPDWSGAYMVVGSVLAALEANYSHRLIRARKIRGPDLLRFRAVEIAFFFVLLRIASTIGLPWHKVLANVQTWSREPWRLFDLEVGYAFVLALSSWAESNQTTYDLARIGEPPAGGKHYVHPVDALIARFFRGGALLLMVAGITRVGIASLLELSRPSVPGLVLNVLVYFVLGLVMLGQIQYRRLSQRWRWEGIDVPRELAGQWARYTLVFLALAGLIAFLLPTGYTLSLLNVASLVLGAILYALNVLFHLLVLAFFLLLTPLAKLFGATGHWELAEPIPPPDLPHLAPGGSLPEWLDVVKSIAFWAVALIGFVYVVRSYLRDRPELVEALITFEPFRAMRRLLAAVWRQLARLAGVVRERIPSQLRLRPRGKDRDQAPERGAFRLFRLGALSRRERMYYYYLSILRRAARHGYRRGESETPYEYETKLGPSIAQAEAELDRVTDAFVETRYSMHEVGRTEEEHMRADSRKIRAALRALREAGETNDKSADRGSSGA